ncbi:hypothetical protein F5876DRAFT_81233 [Lentinula aff. lateritia]|uniref:Uncharacterized protein n=1 Tax=Lentinula aff. lateritia TaxID=2804960 RepID=A0ACC1TMJ3_9AGAR|nr:hypothetical protein F5876DRAFT_81233 [Lentinula aff. lateritia]
MPWTWLYHLHHCLYFLHRHHRHRHLHLLYRLWIVWWTREVESTTSPTSRPYGGLARWIPPLLPPPPPPPPPPPLPSQRPLDHMVDPRGGVHRLHHLPIRLACLYHLHHHLWIVRQTCEVESTASATFSSDPPASTTSTTTSGSWSPPPPLPSYLTHLPPPPPPPPLDRAADSQGGVHYLLVCLTRLRIVTMELGESTFLESMDGSFQLMVEPDLPLEDVSINLMKRTYNKA